MRKPITGVHKKGREPPIGHITKVAGMAWRAGCDECEKWMRSSEAIVQYKNQRYISDMEDKKVRCTGVRSNCPRKCPGETIKPCGHFPAALEQGGWSL